MRAADSDGSGVDEPVRRYRGSPSGPRLLEIGLFFLKLGLVGFGGPLVHIAMMEDELVGEGRRQWADESAFMDGLAICNMLPGPASTQLGIFMGWVRGGNLGAVVAGAAFMAPTFLVVVALSYVYFAYGELPSVEAFFYGVNPVVIGLVGGAGYSMARSALGEGDADAAFTLGGEAWVVDYRLLALLLGAFAATALVNPNPVLEFLVAGSIAVALYERPRVREHLGRVAVGGVVTAALALLYAARDRVAAVAAGWIPVPSALAGLAGVVWGNAWVTLFLFMLYTGSFIFGGGLVLIPFIEKYVVTEFAWLTGPDFVNGIAIGQLTPGPVVMTTAFVGYKLMLDTYGSVGWAVVGAFVAMVGAFAPSFLFVVVGFRYVARIRDNRLVGAALTGINAAVVGAILGATVTLAFDAVVDAFTLLLAATTFAFFTRGVDAAYLIVGGGVLGAGAYFVL